MWLKPSMWKVKFCFCCLVFFNWASAQHNGLTETLSGYQFQSPDIQALQDDSFANPGFLWVDQGKDLFELAPSLTSDSCQSCHGSESSLSGKAREYPKYDDETRQLINIEQRINRCRTRHQSQPALVYESEALLSLTAYVNYLSKGMPFSVSIDGEAAPFFAQGQAYYTTRLGQLNLACTHCHQDNYGKKLRGDTLSQGHSNNYPTYRIDWQTMGSLHRRLRFCNQGVRAQPFEFGAQEYVNLELYLAWRAMHLPLEVPSVRR